MDNMGQYDPERHHRRSIRLRGFDYSKKGMYFVTIGTKNGTEIFGTIVDGVMHLSAQGLIAQDLVSARAIFHSYATYMLNRDEDWEPPTRITRIWPEAIALPESFLERNEGQ
jgi:hypothetical protein